MLSVHANDHNGGICQIASKLNTSPKLVKKVIIWDSSPQFPYACCARAKASAEQPYIDIHATLQDDNWVKNEFVSLNAVYV
ncbi:unnamed protein product [Didymodactylos carnosus]|uniref:Uncharacterized protein n=1 Tax=Didymodactylos carnosus TaxID=1234261 RepID=A0A8S2QCT4_9BILA|nr:unnamed protein product [Didymodactylos carnosus]CAF4093326.1 unnamed protein product [Didymodactylos carnosus]